MLLWVLGLLISSNGRCLEISPSNGYSRSCLELDVRQNINKEYGEFGGENVQEKASSLREAASF
jgi:hypothetical protein